MVEGSIDQVREHLSILAPFGPMMAFVVSVADAELPLFPTYRFVATLRSLELMTDLPAALMVLAPLRSDYGAVLGEIVDELDADRPEEAAVRRIIAAAAASIAGDVAHLVALPTEERAMATQLAHPGELESARNA